MAGLRPWPCSCCWWSVSPYEKRKVSHMRITGQVPLRFLHTVGANFTLQIQRKPIATAVGTASFKKISDKPDKQATQRLPLR